MTLPDSPMYTVSAIPNPFGDWRDKNDSFLSYAEVSMNSSSKKDSMDLEDSDRTLTNDSRTLNSSEEPLSNSFIATENLVSQLCVSAVPQKLFFGDGIVSRSPIHSVR